MRALYALLGMEVMSVVGAKLISNERKTMSYKYNPTVIEMVDGYSVAYGDLGNAMLIGAMFGRLTDQQKETIYREALDQVAQDMEKAGQL
jgi:hypothetical protein